MSDISKLTDQELMDEIYKRGIPFVANIKFIAPKAKMKPEEKLTLETIEGKGNIYFNGCCFEGMY